jgi:excisionase family DNA binding protein
VVFSPRSNDAGTNTGTCVTVSYFRIFTDETISTSIASVKEGLVGKRGVDDEVSAVEAARRLGVGLEYVYSLLWTGKLPGRKIGKTWRVSIEGINQRLKSLAR